MSLSNAVVRTNFSNEMRTLWSYWDTMHNFFNLGPMGALFSNARLRERFIREALTRVINFMPPPTVTLDNQMARTLHGEFSCYRWVVKINSYSMNNTGYGEFIELATTIYHELRHAEQFYRIAQGLSCNQLEFPDLSEDNRLERTFDATQNNNALSAVQRGQQIFGAAPTPHVLSAQQIARLMYMPRRIATRATQNAANDFQNFITAARPGWCRQATILDAVKDWMNFTYKKSNQQPYMASNRDDNGDDIVRTAGGDTNRYLIYRSDAMEKDAFGIETFFKPHLETNIGVNAATHPLIGRPHPLFNHLPS
ncbi:hypothetical protein ACJ5NV_01540 [Loktanella agnita]|uniref:hypothetical protein n=1 Tax=Loktanella agnita TaxID=287097 RepID=UPI003986D331